MQEIWQNLTTPGSEATTRWTWLIANNMEGNKQKRGMEEVFQVFYCTVHAVALMFSFCQCQKS